MTKLLGCSSLVSWLAQIATDDDERERRALLHPALLYLLIGFLGWMAMSAAWADVPEVIPELLLRYGPNAMLFLIVFAAVRTAGRRCGSVVRSCSGR